MRVIKPDSGFLYYQKIFKQIMANQCKVVVWQVLPQDGRREISESLLNSFHPESGKLFFQLEANSKLHPELPVYCYVEDGPLIFKTSVDHINDSNLCTLVPSELKLLEEAEYQHIQGSLGQKISTHWSTKRLDTSPLESENDYVKVKSMAQRSSRDQDLLNNEFGPITLDEEDKLFADKRASPRARPKLDKWVKVVKKSGESSVTYKLFDLSRGGLGFMVYDEQEFEKGSEIQIVGFNDFDLDDPLIGKIMSIRPVDENQIEFKVGVKFSEGQD